MTKKELLREIQARKAFVDGMLTYTARLVRTDNKIPIGGGSGILFSNEKRLFLLSVVHVFEKKGWSLEFNFQTDQGTLHFPIPEINWLASISLEKTFSEEKFDGLAWVEFDCAKIKDLLIAEQQKYKKEIELPIYSGPIDCIPSLDNIYNFGSNVTREFHSSFGNLVIEPVYELDMKFDGEDDRGYYCFKLSEKHKGDEFYSGSSGSSIMDMQGRIVALVQGGCANQNLIYGVPISKYANALKIT